MNFKNFYIQEKLNPSQFRSYVKAWKESGISQRYDNVFGDKDRIYIPFEAKVDKKVKKSYIQQSVEQILDAAGWAVKDYAAGIAQQNGKEMKIGKVITRFIEKVKKTGDPPKPYYNISWLENTLKSFASDPDRDSSKQKGLMIVISRHAYDIAGMSTDRGWTSCQNLQGGALKGYVIKDIKAGTLIAYLIKENDKNIQKPLGRILLKPFYNDDTGDFIVVPAKKYGSVPGNFKREVEKWANKNINKGKYGEFHIEDVYKGDSRKVKKISPKMSWKQFKEAQDKIRVPIVETAEQLVKYWEDKEHFNWIKSNRTFFIDNIGKKNIGSVYIKSTINLNASQVEEMFMKYYWQEREDIKTYHNNFLETIMTPFTEVGPEIDDMWAVISLFVVYNDIHKFPANMKDAEIAEKVDYILNDSHKYWFEKRYCQTDEDKNRIKQKFIAFFNKHGRGRK